MHPIASAIRGLKPYEVNAQALREIVTEITELARRQIDDDDHLLIQHLDSAYDEILNADWPDGKPDDTCLHCTGHGMGFWPNTHCNFCNGTGVRPQTQLDY